MKIALISTRSTSGKTVTSLLLGGIWAKISKTHVYHMTTGSFDEYFNTAPEIDLKMKGHTPELKTSLRAASIESAESFATSFTNAGNYPICEFSDPTSPEEKAEAVKGFSTLLTPSSLVLIEISNDADVETNSAVINACDVALVIARPIAGEYERVKEILSKYSVVIPHLVLLNGVNNRAITVKELQVWFPEKFLTLSYNPTIQKYLNKRKLEGLLDSIVRADNDTTTLRQEIHGILSRLYAPVKIQEVSRWA